MRKLKSKVEICKVPSMTLVFLPRYREARKLPLVLVGAPRKGQAPGRITPWIASGLPHAQVGLRCAFWQASPEPLPTVFTIKLPTETPRALFPLVHGGGHTTNTVGVISQDYKPLRCTTTVHASTEWQEVCKPHKTQGLNLEQAHKRWSNQSKHFAKTRTLIT